MPASTMLLKFAPMKPMKINLGPVLSLWRKERVNRKKGCSKRRNAKERWYSDA